MNEDMAMADMLEYQRRSAKANRTGWMKSEDRITAPARQRLARVVLALAARLAPSKPGLETRPLSHAAR